MQKRVLTIVLIMCMTFLIGCASYSTDEPSTAENTETIVEAEDRPLEDREPKISKDEVNDDTDDRNMPRETYEGHSFSRAISYNEMLEIMDEFYNNYASLSPIDMDATDKELDAALEEEEQLIRSIADENNITYDDFNAFFYVVDIEDQNRMKAKNGLF